MSAHSEICSCSACSFFRDPREPDGTISAVRATEAYQTLAEAGALAITPLAVLTLAMALNPNDPAGALDALAAHSWRLEPDSLTDAEMDEVFPQLRATEVCRHGTAGCYGGGGDPCGSFYGSGASCDVCIHVRACHR
jgi:hypothetical protein